MQYGLVTVAQLAGLGLSASAVSKRVRRGTLHRVGRGVYAVGHTALSEQARWLAAVLAGGGGMALTGLACAKHWQVWRYRVHLIDVVGPRRHRAEPPVRAHWARNLDRRDVTVHKGIPCTTIARLLVDLTDELTKWELANVIHKAEFRNIFNLAATSDARNRAIGRRYLARLDDALALRASGSAGARSRGELKLLKLLEQQRLPEPRVNTPLCGYEVDLHWPAMHLAIELDGFGHRRRRTRTEDANKEAAWRAGGFEVLRFGEDDLRAATGAVAARVRPTGSSC